MSSQDPAGTEDLRERSLGELLKQLSGQTTRWSIRSWSWPRPS